MVKLEDIKDAEDIWCRGMEDLGGRKRDHIEHQGNKRKYGCKRNDL